MEIKGFESSGQFFDDKNFPWGFRRCGDFTIKQAEILQHYGRTLAALEKKERSPVTPEEKKFVAVCSGKEAPTTAVELAWAKYRGLILNRKAINAFGHSKSDGKDDIIEFVDDAIDDG